MNSFLDMSHINEKLFKETNGTLKTDHLKQIGEYNIGHLHTIVIHILNTKIMLENIRKYEKHAWK